MTIADEFRTYANDCYRMALATNNPEWNRLAERWLHCADLDQSATAAAECLRKRPAERDTARV
jgi:hypothetical protein